MMDTTRLPLNPILKVFLDGVYDEDCDLHKLLGLWHILERIWHHVKQYWKENIRKTGHIKNQTEFKKDDMISFLNIHAPTNYECFPFIDLLRNVVDDSGYKLFPEPSDININMMPFILHDTFEESCLPDYLKGYWSIIADCCLDRSQQNTICYLTIQESWVEAGHSQRREGIHVERPGKLDIKSADTAYDNVITRENDNGKSIIHKNSCYHHWGRGCSAYGMDRFEVKGGIYAATNVKNSCRFWDCQILDDTLIGNLGDLSHLQSMLPNDNHVMAANCLYWFTDRTPHESLPLKERAYRQYFRLVTSEVSLWFEDHSTKNPLVAPDPKVTKIVKGNKFVAGDLKFKPSIKD